MDIRTVKDHTQRTLEGYETLLKAVKDAKAINPNFANYVDETETFLATEINRLETCLEAIKIVQKAEKDASKEEKPAPKKANKAKKVEEKQAETPVEEIIDLDDLI